MRLITLAAVAMLAAFLTACGSSGNSSSSTPPAPAPAAATNAALTQSQYQQICNDINTWAAQAENEDMPRFNAQMESDESEAQGTQLGSDLSTLDQDLQSENTAALLPGPPGYPTDQSALQQDCTPYGVNIQL